MDLPTIRSFASREPHTCRRGQAQPQRPHLAARLPPCAARARHLIRAQKGLDAAVSSQPAVLMETRGDLHWQQAEDIARERKLVQLRVTCMCDRFKISQDRVRNLDETAVHMVPAGERGWTKKPSQSVTSPRAPSSRSRSRRT